MVEMQSAGQNPNPVIIMIEGWFDSNVNTQLESLFERRTDDSTQTVNHREVTTMPVRSTENLCLQQWLLFVDVFTGCRCTFLNRIAW